MVCHSKVPRFHLQGILTGPQKSSLQGGKHKILLLWNPSHTYIPIYQLEKVWRNILVIKSEAHVSEFFVLHQIYKGSFRTLGVEST